MVSCRRCGAVCVEWSESSDLIFWLVVQGRS